MSVHPDDEALSAHLDDEAPEWEDHVRSCPACQARLAAFGRVSAAVGTAPPPPLPGAADEAVARAVAAAAAPPSRWRSRRLVAAAAGIAAAALVAGGVVALVDRGPTQSNFTAASKSAGPVAADVVEAGNLGDLADDAALKARIEPSLAGREAAAAGAPAPLAAGGAAGAANQTTAPQSTRPDEARSSRSVAGTLPCEAKARALQPGTQVLVYRATARWRGTPAVVFGFRATGPVTTRTAGGLPPTRVYVMARAGCALLHFQSYAP